MAEIIYEKMYRLQLPVETIGKISECICSERNPIKKVPVNGLPTEFYVVYCNCSDGDIQSESTSSGFYIEGIPQVVFVDPEAPNPIWQLIAHEIIHDMQKFFFNDFDFDSEYSGRWQEIMAYKLQDKVSVWIQKEKTEYELVMRGNDEISNFQLECYRQHEEDKLSKQLEIDERIKFQKSVDEYFEDNEDKHNW